jgi:hypothetical protein
MGACAGVAVLEPVPDVQQSQDRIGQIGQINQINQISQINQIDHIDKQPPTIINGRQLSAFEVSVLNEQSRFAKLSNNEKQKYLNEDRSGGATKQQILRLSARVAAACEQQRLRIVASLPSMGRAINNINGIDKEDGQQEKKEEPKRNDEEHCVICLEGYGQTDPVVLGPCAHSYHPSCYGSWCEHNNSCPICRAVPIVIHALEKNR